MTIFNSLLDTLIAKSPISALTTNKGQLCEKIC